MNYIIAGMKHCGISTGEELVFRVAIKPTSSISADQKTIDINGNEVICSTTERHDPCICPTCPFR